MQTQAISPTIRSSTTNDNLTVHCSLHPGSGYPGHPRLLFWIHLQQPDGFGSELLYKSCAPPAMPSVPGHAIGNILGQPKERKSWRCDFEDIWHGPWDDVGVEYSWHMWCHGPGNFQSVSKHPLFAPNASLSSLEGDDKEPSCAGEAILAWKSSQSHPLFMCKHASWQANNERQCHSCH